MIDSLLYTYAHKQLRMASSRAWLLAVVVGAVLTVAQSSSVLLFDSRAHAYLQPGTQVSELQASGLSSLLAALTGLQPATHIDNDMSQQVCMEHPAPDQAWKLHPCVIQCTDSPLH